MEIDEHDTPGLFFSRELIGKHLPVRHWWMVFKATGQGDLTWGTCLDVHEGRSGKEGSRRGGKKIEKFSEGKAELPRAAGSQGR